MFLSLCEITVKKRGGGGLESLGARSDVITGCSKKTKDLQSENRQHTTCITCRASNFFFSF